MKKSIFFISAIALTMSACADKDAFTIEGKVASDIANDTKVYLQELDLDFKTKNVIDSAVVIDGVYHLSGKAKASPRVGSIVYDYPDHANSVAQFILDAGEIKISNDDPAKALGTAANDSYQVMVDKQTALKNLSNEIKARLKDLEPADREAEIERLEEISEEFQASVKSYVMGNIQNQMGVKLLTNLSFFFNLDELKSSLDRVDPAYLESKSVADLKKRVDIMDATKEGSQFTDLKAKDPKGDDIALSSFIIKNEYVLVDFWASWCPPCRAEIPTLVKVYKEYKSKGFEIVGVSLDSDQEDWVNGIKDLNITWPQMSDLNKWNSELSKAYGVNSIPHTILINKEGKIIARGLDAEQVGEKLAELLK